MGKVIWWELCKKLKFDHTTKWYTHKPETVLENEMHKILWDFEVQADHLISVRRPNSNDSQKKRTCHIVNFAILMDHWVKIKENKKRDKYSDPVRELRKLWNIRLMVIPIVIGILGTVPQGL